MPCLAPQSDIPRTLAPSDHEDDPHEGPEGPSEAVVVGGG